MVKSFMIDLYVLMPEKKVFLMMGVVSNQSRNLESFIIQNIWKHVFI